MRAQRYIYLYEHLRNTFCENILEIGTCQGEGAEVMLRVSKNPNVHYYGIDLFENITPEVLKKEDSLTPDPVEKVLARLQKVSPNIHLFKGFSSDNEIINQISRTSFDLIYIDGGHSFETVQNDFENYVKFLKSSGIIFLDDYNTEFTGIKRYVDGYLINNPLYDVIIYEDQKDHYRGHDFKLVKVTLHAQ